jgi:uncharacterized repeat protein (TIGR03803 family)
VAKTSRLLFVLACAVAITSGARAQSFSVLHTFQYFPHGASPYAPLYRDSSLYGTTNGGGQYNAGVVFKLNPSGNEKMLYTFTGGTDGGNPCAGVVMDLAGNLYGTTYRGGLAGAGVNQVGAGVVFKIDTSGQYTVLYTFTGGGDGSGPFAGVILDLSGNLYGTTYYGGASGDGVVYKVTPSGGETVLYSFAGGTSTGNDGANPYAGVTMDAVGNLYGTTYNGGGYSKGVIYKISPSGQETLLYNLGCCGKTTTGYYPTGGVVLDSQGNIYGTAGVVYKLDTAGNFTMLAKMLTGLSGLVRDASGNLFFASYQGAKWPEGAVFKLDTSGKVSVLYKFKGSVVTSGIPLPIAGGLNANPVLDAAGNLYGTTPYQGTAGIVYEIQASGKVKSLYDFKPATGGSEPSTGLTLAWISTDKNSPKI